MNKVKLLSFISIGPLIANFVLIGFIVIEKPPHHRRKNPKDLIIKRLRFDNTQIEKYEALIITHKTDIGNTESQIKTLKNQLYSTLNQEIKDQESIESLFSSIADKDRAMEVINYNHFEDIKKICNPEQLEDFKQFSQEIANLFDHKVPPHRRDE